MISVNVVSVAAPPLAGLSYKWQDESYTAVFAILAVLGLLGSFLFLLLGEPRPDPRPAPRIGLSLAVDYPARCREYPLEHLRCQTPCQGVLLAWMVRRQQDRSVWEGVRLAVPEPGSGPGVRLGVSLNLTSRPQVGVEGDFPPGAQRPLQRKAPEARSPGTALHVSISSRLGLLSGGAQRTAAVT